MSLSKLGDSEGQGSLVCCSPRGCKELNTTERLNWTDLLMKKCIGLLIAPDRDANINLLLTVI